MMKKKFCAVRILSVGQGRSAITKKRKEAAELQAPKHSLVSGRGKEGVQVLKLNGQGGCPITADRAAMGKRRLVKGDGKAPMHWSRRSHRSGMEGGKVVAIQCVGLMGSDQQGL